jgi:putative ATPase
LFIDEIHRLNRAQQDVLLPFVEAGSVVLIGATTENPSFELNSALLSRCTVLALQPLDEAALAELLARAEEAEGKQLPLTQEARQSLCRMADGDGRYLLGMVEQLLAMSPKQPLDAEAMAKALRRRAPRYDRDKEGHYNLISALHKAVRGSDADAALYWCHRMLDGGEDPHFLFRRLARMALEDIGLADPQAIGQVMHGWQAYERLGSPEGDLALSQAVLYLALAPKSNAVYSAHKLAAADAREHGSLMPPMHAVNAPTRLMKELGYSDGYIYDHDLPEGCAGQGYFPDAMPRATYYQPTEHGIEKRIAERKRWVAGLQSARMTSKKAGG